MGNPWYVTDVQVCIDVQVLMLNVYQVPYCPIGTKDINNLSFHLKTSVFGFA